MFLRKFGLSPNYTASIHRNPYLHQNLRPDTFVDATVIPVALTLNVALYSVNILDKVRKLAGLQQFTSISYQVSRS
jgi:hypothetical protein